MPSRRSKKASGMCSNEPETMVKINSVFSLRSPVVTAAWKRNREKNLYWIVDLRHKEVQMVFWQGFCEGTLEIAAMTWTFQRGRGKIHRYTYDELKESIESGHIQLEREEPNVKW